MPFSNLNDHILSEEQLMSNGKKHHVRKRSIFARILKSILN